MNRAFLFSFVCLLIVPVVSGCRDERARMELEKARAEAREQAEEAETMLQELQQELKQEVSKSKKHVEAAEYQHNELSAVVHTLEKKTLELTIANAKLADENTALKKSLAEMESLKQELAALKGAQEKPAEE